MPKQRKCALNTFVYVSGIENSKLKQSVAFEVLKLTDELGGKWRVFLSSFCKIEASRQAQEILSARHWAKRRGSMRILKAFKQSRQQTQWQAGVQSVTIKPWQQSTPEILSEDPR